MKFEPEQLRSELNSALERFKQQDRNLSDVDNLTKIASAYNIESQQLFFIIILIDIFMKKERISLKRLIDDLTEEIR